MKLNPDIQTGRNVYADKDLYESDESYKAKIDSYVKEGFKLVYEGGGGGSSDFSTAQVTFVNNTDYDFYYPEAYGCLEANEYHETLDAGIYNGLTVGVGETKTFKVPLYKGHAFFVGPLSEYTISGNIENIDDVALMITGNGTITKS